MSNNDGSYSIPSTATACTRDYDGSAFGRIRQPRFWVLRIDFRVDICLCTLNQHLDYTSLVLEDKLLESGL